jgi:zinc transport system permease protein
MHISLPIFTMIDELLQIFQYQFMIRAMLAGIVVSIIAPLIGFFLVVRRFSLLVDTLAHISLIGIAGGLLVNTSPLMGAVVASALAGIGMEKLRQNKRLFSESIMAIFLSGSLALTLVLFSLGSGLGVSILNYLFGNITTVSNGELWAITGVGLVVLLTVALYRKKLFLISYDEELAKVNGMNTSLYNYLLMALVGITVALSIRVVGALLIGALVVIPVVSAIQLGFGFGKTMIMSVIISLVSVIIGIYSSFYLDLPSSATIVVILLMFFVTALITKKYDGRRFKGRI